MVDVSVNSFFDLYLTLVWNLMFDGVIGLQVIYSHHEVQNQETLNAVI